MADPATLDLAYAWLSSIIRCIRRPPPPRLPLCASLALCLWSLRGVSFPVVDVGEEAAAAFGSQFGVLPWRRSLAATSVSGVLCSLLCPGVDAPVGEALRGVLRCKRLWGELLCMTSGGRSPSTYGSPPSAAKRTMPPVSTNTFSKPRCRKRLAASTAILSSLSYKMISVPSCGEAGVTAHGFFLSGMVLRANRTTLFRKR
mmetsp:Transcript_6232/g.24304  ORF Transcript_6232/g.24304 Transcript_6232/m.24304 type:complete len:201 (+) Transcript_6232:1455-2057(+)